MVAGLRRTWVLNGTMATLLFEALTPELLSRPARALSTEDFRFGILLASAIEPVESRTKAISYLSSVVSALEITSTS